MATPRRRRCGVVEFRRDWNIWKMPEQCTTIELNKDYSRDEIEAIKMGISDVPNDDKWFVDYDKSNNKLRMHRQLTGYCIYVVQFEENKEKGSFTAKTVIVNRDSSQYTGNNDEEDKLTVSMLMDRVILEHTV